VLIETNYVLKDGFYMSKDMLIRWWCCDCEDKFYVSKIKSDKAQHEGKTFFCVYCGSNKFTVNDEIND
jgi:Zn finger protein HypA/HybF involved in hydrogenase expression